LASILADVDREISFLKVDVEGWELQVLRSNDWSRHRPVVVLIEALDPSTLSPAWETWEGELIGHGYTFVYYDGLNRFYLREDRQDLLKAFATPPNVFDAFEPAELAECRQKTERVETSESTGPASLKRLDHVEDDIRHLRHQFQQLEASVPIINTAFQAIEEQLRTEREQNHILMARERTLAEAERARTELLRDELRASEERVASIQVALQENEQRLSEQRATIERLEREYLTQRLWAGQLAQEKADVLIRLRQLEAQVAVT
jgi:hypothetical protein